MNTRRRWLFRLAAILLVPACWRWRRWKGPCGWRAIGYDTAFFVKARVGGKEFLVNNDSFVLRFFPPEKVRRPRPRS
jgi:hypothetical protein